MRKAILTLLLSAVAFAAVSETVATAQRDSTRTPGFVTGSFETNSALYANDKGAGTIVDGDPFGSNNYIKIDYYRGRFSAGMQAEGYLPAMAGFPTEFKGVGISNLYASWTDGGLSFTAGTFYDQFGSGLLFRSWEDRALGLNNTVAGARVSYSWRDIVAVKALWGRPRFGMGFAPTQVRGADLSFAFSNIFDSTWYGALEGSVLNKYEPIPLDIEAAGGKASRTGFSARLNLEASGAFLKAEKVFAGKKYYPVLADPVKEGHAELVEAGYNGHGLGFTLTARRMEWMDSQIVQGEGSTANMINYVPSLCTQHTYMLTSLHPYSAQTGNAFNSGEIGGQVDAFYSFRRGTALGGKRGMKVHVNFATYYTLAVENSFKAGNLLMRDVVADLEKWIGKKLRINLLWTMQDYSPSYGFTKDIFHSNIFVADLLYKWKGGISTRLELQYLHSKDDHRDWMAALAELNFAPRWSIFASDMFNHGDTGRHYYNAGVSYTHSRTRIAAGYGRYRAGYICSGGVCRQIPAYTGASLSITTSF